MTVLGFASSNAGILQMPREAKVNLERRKYKEKR